MALDIVESKRLVMVDPNDDGEREARGEDAEDDESSKVRLSASRRRARDDDDTDDDEDDDDVGGATSLSDGRSNVGGSLSDLARLRREKRLAMNRASARERRRRKKVLIETLEDQVQELTKRNKSLQSTNTNLRTRVEQLENDLAQTRALVTRLESSRVPIVNMHDIPDAFAAAAHQDSIRNALLAAGAADGAALHQAAASLSAGNSSLTSSGYLGSPAILNDVLAQREILNAQVMAERHRRAAMFETASLNQLRQVHHGQLGLGGLLGQNTVRFATCSLRD